MIIGLKLQLENEDEPLFAYLGRTIDFNGIHIEQSRYHIMFSYKNYIDQMLCAHSRYILPAKPFLWLTKIPSPLPDNTVHKVYKEYDPDEGTATAYKFEL